MGANTWFLFGCLGIIGGFILFAIIFGEKQNYEVKNTLPILPVDNINLMDGDQITTDDVESILAHSKNKIKRKSVLDSRKTNQSVLGLKESSHQNSDKKILGYTESGEVIIGYTKDGKPILELSDPSLKKIKSHWSSIKRNNESIEKQMKNIKRQLIPIKSTAYVRLDHRVSNLDGSSSAICTIQSNHIGKLKNTNGTTISGVFYSIKNSNRMVISFKNIILNDGKKIGVSAYAISPDGSSGIPANVESNIGNDVINLLTNQFVASQTNEVSQIVLQKTMGQSELETDRHVYLEKGIRFKIYFDEPVFI
jgi:hypothetical protein